VSPEEPSARGLNTLCERNVVGQIYNSTTPFPFCIAVLLDDRLELISFYVAYLSGHPFNLFVYIDRYFFGFRIKHQNIKFSTAFCV